MDALREFWLGHRNEILVTGLVILLIQLITTALGVLGRKRNMRRVDEDQNA